MTAKEKALQLVNEFSLVGLQQREEGIACALIAVEEILDDDMYDMSEELFVKRIEYWQKVKEEIENL